MPRTCIFLVEDEALIQMMVVDMVDELGHGVVAEVGSIEAAEPLARTAVFDLILECSISTSAALSLLRSRSLLRHGAYRSSSPAPMVLRGKSTAYMAKGIRTRRL